MEVILNETIPSLGFIGDVVKVKEGYARNYLLPKGLALEASKRNKKELEHHKRQAEIKRSTLLKEAQAYMVTLNAVTVSLAKVAGEEGKLYGSVTASDVADALAQQGVTIDRKLLVIATPIKTLGEHYVTVKLHPDVTAKIKVEVNPAAE